MISESGVLIKQFVIDEPFDHATLVIVPETLMIQWQQELTHRFHLGHLLDESIHLVSSRRGCQDTWCVARNGPSMGRSRQIADAQESGECLSVVLPERSRRLPGTGWQATEARENEVAKTHDSPR